MPDSGTSAFDTYVWDPQSSAWRHLPNDGLHYAESGTITWVQPEKLAPGNLTYLVYFPLRNGNFPPSLPLLPWAVPPAPETHPSNLCSNAS